MSVVKKRKIVTIKLVLSFEIGTIPSKKPLSQLLLIASFEIFIEAWGCVLPPLAAAFTSSIVC